MNQTTSCVESASPEREAVSLIKYPSVASLAICRMLGGLFDSIPWPRINGIKPSCLLFTLPLSPIPAVAYFFLKVTGDRYVLTDRSIQRRKALGDRMVSRVELSEIAEIAIRQERGQAFYRAADVRLIGEQGEELLLLEGITYPEIFRQNVLKARDAVLEVEASLETIRARQTA